MLHDDDDVLATVASFLHRKGTIVQTTSVRIQAQISVARYLTLDISSFLEEQSPSELGKLKQMVEQGIANKAVVPLPSKVYGRDELQEAFSAAGDPKLSSKVVVKVSGKNLESLIVL